MIRYVHPFVLELYRSGVEGTFLLPEQEIGLVSTLCTTVDEPDGTQTVTVEHDRSLIFVKCMNSSIVVMHTVAEIAEALAAAPRT